MKPVAIVNDLLYATHIKKYSYVQISSAFADVFENIPQDKLPVDFLNKRIQRHEDAESLWRKQWNKQHEQEYLQIRTAMFASEDYAEDKIQVRAKEYQDQRHHFIAEQMVHLLRSRHVEVPKELTRFIGEGRGGSKEAMK